MDRWTEPSKGAILIRTTSLRIALARFSTMHFLPMRIMVNYDWEGEGVNPLTPTVVISVQL